jgi:hypothetical protein
VIDATHVACAVCKAKLSLPLGALGNLNAHLKNGSHGTNITKAREIKERERQALQETNRRRSASSSSQRSNQIHVQEYHDGGGGFGRNDGGRRDRRRNDALSSDDDDLSSPY